MKNLKIWGIILSILGVVCLVYPIAASVWIEVVVGSCFIISAFFVLAGFFSRKGGWNKFYAAVTAVLYFIAGVLMLSNPFGGIFALTVIMGVVFVFEGAAAIAFWGANKGILNSWLMLINGAASILLGAIALFCPSCGIWFIGTLAGVDFLFTGVALFGLEKDFE